MIKKSLVIIALFSATQIIESAERKTPTPPTDKAQPQSGSLRPRSRTNTAHPPQPKPTNDDAHTLRSTQSGDLSALVAEYRNEAGLAPQKPLAPQQAVGEKTTPQHPHSLGLLTPPNSSLSLLPDANDPFAIQGSASNPEVPTDPLSARKAERRQTIIDQRTKRGLLSPSNNVLFYSPESTPTALAVSPTTEVGAVACTFQPIPHKDNLPERTLDRLNTQKINQFTDIQTFKNNRDNAQSENEKNHWNNQLKKAKCAQLRFDYFNLQEKIENAQSQIIRDSLEAQLQEVKTKIETILEHQYTDADDSYDKYREEAQA